MNRSQEAPGETGDFDDLSPEMILSAIEDVLAPDSGQSLTGLLIPYNSYINRVYEVRTDRGERLMAKFYRPGRWTTQAIQEEHRFLAACGAQEIPAVCPLALGGPGGPTLARTGNYPFALFPKKAGRLFEINGDEDYLRVGALIARIHSAGDSPHHRVTAGHRITLHPRHSGRRDLDYLLKGGDLPPRIRQDFETIGNQILQEITPLFDNLPLQPIHGDCHRGNILERPGEGLMIIDFDDMAYGPALQDLWMLLPDHIGNCRREAGLLHEGYSRFRPLPLDAFKLTEGLRALRMLYFLAWCARQRKDRQFREDNPRWGTPGFWQEEIEDLKNQLEEIRDNPYV